MTASLRIRSAVRALIIDEQQHVLLVRLVFPDGIFWVLPGGGIDHNENHLVALHRELAEEVGLFDATIGDPVWERTHHFRLTTTDGEVFDGQTERVYLVRTHHFVPQPTFSYEQLRTEGLHEIRWWNLDDIRAHIGPEIFVPQDLHLHVHNVVTDGVPAKPWVFHQVTENYD